MLRDCPKTAFILKDGGSERTDSYPDVEPDLQTANAAVLSPRLGDAEVRHKSSCVCLHLRLKSVKAAVQGISSSEIFRICKHPEM